MQKLWSDIKYEVTGHGCTLGSGPQYFSTDPFGLCLAGGSPGSPVTAVTSPKDGCYDPGFLGVRITDIQGLLIIGGRCITDPKLGEAGTGLVMASCKIINGPARDQVWRYDSTHHWWVLAATGCASPDQGSSRRQIRRCAWAHAGTWPAASGASSDRLGRRGRDHRPASSAACSRTLSRLARPAAVRPPPSQYLMHLAETPPPGAITQARRA